MGQCRTLEADVTVWCYCGDYSACDNNIRIYVPFFLEKKRKEKDEGKEKGKKIIKGDRQ